MKWLPLVLLSACAGYDDLPLQLRELGGLRIERVERYVEGPGVIQIALDPPNDATGPFVVVGSPTVESTGARVIAWAFGPCKGAPTPPDSAQRLCLSTQWASHEPLFVTVVLESRGDARRFSLFGSEASE